jgi:hypothetical protein
MPPMSKGGRREQASETNAGNAEQASNKLERSQTDRGPAKTGPVRPGGIPPGVTTPEGTDVENPT